MKFKSALFALALTAISSSVYANQVQVFNGPTDLPLTKNFGLFVLEDLGSFTDRINFGLVSSAEIKAVNVSNFIPNNTAPIYDWHITNGEVQLFDATNNKVGSSWMFDGTTGQTDHVYNLVAGSYYFEVTGIADGTGLNFGHHLTNGNYTFAVTTAVPEPESYAMMLAGLGLLGFAARRKLNG